MNKILPNSIKQLYIIYTENSSIVSGLTNLSVTIYDLNRNIILDTTILSEEGISGIYSYNWSVGDLPQELQLVVIYKAGNLLLSAEEYMIDIESDNTGRAF